MTPEVQIVVWNVAHGSATFVRTPNDRKILLDVGSSEDFSPAEYLHNHYGLRYTDLLILSHADADHVRDLPNVVRLIPPQTFYRNPQAPRSLIFPTDPPPCDPLKSFDSFNSNYVHPVRSGNEVNIADNWGGLSIGTLWPTAVNNFTCLNNYSVVTIMDYGCLSFVFPGDLESPGFTALMSYAPFVAATKPADRYRVLVAPHHGHTAGIHQPFLDHFSPHLSIISGAYGDPHTDRETYAACSSGLKVFDQTTQTVSTCKVLTTKLNDSIVLRADSQQLTITV